jgi:hypothetical protein
MKMQLLIFAFILAIVPLYAQTEREDVIYMKSGTVYRGTMLEQVYGASYKIQIAGGSIILVQAAEIEKITKEPLLTTDTFLRSNSHAYTQEEWAGHNVRNRWRHGHGENYAPEGYKDKGGFFEAQISIMYAGGGVRLMGGYKFSQFAMLGLGIGMDCIYSEIKQYH